MVFKRVYLLLLGIMALLASCSDGHTDDIPESPVIGFRTAVSGETRALETDNSNLNSFRVWSVWARNEANNDYVRPYMDGVKVERTNNNSNWEYSPVSYWPAAGHLDFFAYAPVASTGVKAFATTETGSVYNQGATILYDVTTDHRAQEDFVVAAATNQTSNPAQLTFSHVLSQVQFTVRSRTAGVTLYIRQIVLRNLYRTGTLVYNNGNWTWNDSTNLERYPIYLPEPKEIAFADGFVSLTDSKVGHLMVLPQTVTKGTATPGTKETPSDLNNNFYIVVTYDTNTETNITAYYTPASLDGYFIFKPNEKYTFNLSIE